MNAMTNTPHSSTIKGTEHSVLCAFALWPGEAELEQTLVPRKTTDFDKHPLVTLDLNTFELIGADLNEEWLRMDSNGSGTKDSGRPKASP